MDSKFVRDRYNSALWYAWGRIDSGAYEGLLKIEDGFAFADEQQAMARDFVEERRGFLLGVLSSFDEFVARKRAEREAQVAA